MARSDVGQVEQAIELVGGDELDLYSEEQRQTLLWRLTQFRSLGFDFATAVVMADSPADLGQARKLMRAGCPLETAQRILL